MNWFDRMGIWMMQNPTLCVFIFVALMALYIWLIYIEEKWK